MPTEELTVTVAAADTEQPIPRGFKRCLSKQHPRDFEPVIVLTDQRAIVIGCYQRVAVPGFPSLVAYGYTAIQGSTPIPALAWRRIPKHWR